MALPDKMNSKIETLTEDAIVAGLKGGELDPEEAYAVLYSKLYPFLRMVARHYRHPDEDVVIDTLAQLPSLLATYKGKGSLRAYLVAVLRNRIVYKYRQLRRGPKIEEIESIQEDELEKATIVPSRGDTTLLVRELLENLSEEDRLIVTARLVEGATIEEIAKMLHSSNSKVHRKFVSAMKKLQALIAREGTTEDA